MSVPTMLCEAIFYPDLAKCIFTYMINEKTPELTIFDYKIDVHKYTVKKRLDLSPTPFDITISGVPMILMGSSG